MPTTQTAERDEIRMLAEECSLEIFRGRKSPVPALRATVASIIEGTLRRRLVPAAAYSLPVKELRVGPRKERK